MGVADGLQRRFTTVRLGGALALALLAGVTLGAVAQAEGRPVWPPAVLGAIAGGAWGWLSRRVAGLAEALDPASDPDALVRAVLSVERGHPLRSRLERAAAGRRIRFRPLGELRPLALCAAAALVAALWADSTPAVGGRGLAAPGGGLAGAAASRPSPRGAAGGARTGAAAAKRPAPVPAAPPRAAGDPGSGEHGPGGGEAGAGEGVWTRAEALSFEDTGFLAGQDLGEFRPVVDRYLRIRSEQQP